MIQRPVGFPIVVTEKKDGRKRFCVDFGALNKIIKKKKTLDHLQLLTTY